MEESCHLANKAWCGTCEWLPSEAAAVGQTVEERQGGQAGRGLLGRRRRALSQRRPAQTEEC